MADAAKGKSSQTGLIVGVVLVIAVVVVIIIATSKKATAKPKTTTKTGTPVKDATGKTIGTINAVGNVVNAAGTVVGAVGAGGVVQNASGQTVGQAVSPTTGAPTTGASNEGGASPAESSTINYVGNAAAPVGQLPNPAQMEINLASQIGQVGDSIVLNHPSYPSVPTGTIIGWTDATDGQSGWLTIGDIAFNQNVPGVVSSDSYAGTSAGAAGAGTHPEWGFTDPTPGGTVALVAQTTTPAATPPQTADGSSFYASAASPKSASTPLNKISPPRPIPIAEAVYRKILQQKGMAMGLKQAGLRNYIRSNAGNYTKNTPKPITVPAAKKLSADAGSDWAYAEATSGKTPPPMPTSSKRSHHKFTWNGKAWV